MSNKQTAVEWLKIKYKQQGMLFDKDLQQAKEMEKEQTLRDYSHGVKDAITDINSVDCNRYYKEEYGKDA